MAAIFQQEGDLEAAYRSVSWALSSRPRSASPGGNLSNALELGLRLGRGRDVEPAGLEVLRLASTTDDRISTIWGLTGLTQVELGCGDLELAGLLWGAVAGEVERDPIDLSQPDFPAYSAPLREVNDPRFLQAASVGRATASGRSPPS